MQMKGRRNEETNKNRIRSIERRKRNKENKRKGNE